MNPNRYCYSIDHKQSSDLSALECKRKSTIKHPLITVFLTLTLIFTVISASADQLWNNGDTDGNATLGWGQYSSILDDFYVPGGGWWINRVETIGIFIDHNTVSEVEIAIWPHNMEENEPNGDDVELLTGIDFEASPTGRTFLDREEIKIKVDFDKHYLKGQRYYWIEFIVRDQYGREIFGFLARSGVSHEPAWTHFGQGSISPSEDVYGSELDLSYALYGSPIKVHPDFAPVGRFFVTDRSAAPRVNECTPVLDRTMDGFKMRQFQHGPNQIDLGLVSKCPKGKHLSPFEMPIYDDDGLFVVDYKTVWYCIPDNLKPER